MRRIIKPAELHGKNTVALARWLLGKVLIRVNAAGRSEHIITEVEAYHTEVDRACHASKGRTKRTEVMYQSGGRWYIYLCYGVHEMLNLVTGPEDHASAVLIRGVGDISGPGRLTKRLRIGRGLNNQPATPASGLYLEDHGVVVSRNSVKVGPRVGVGYAGKFWAAKPWRFQYQHVDLGAGRGR